jgi:hypothetical protein
MDPQKQKTSAKDFFLNLGAIVALYTTIIALLNLLFTVINSAFPQITQYYSAGSASISFPTATLIIFFPIYILLMWLLEKSYNVEPEKKHLGVRKWLTYITLFIAGLTLAGDLVTVLYYFIDGQELTAGFLLKVLVVLVVILAVFLYYISDIREKLTTKSRKVWAALSVVFILACITWGFLILGSPRTQQLIKYDQQKVSDLQNINYQVQDYYNLHGVLPNSISDLSGSNYSPTPIDQQTGQSYEYVLIGQSAKTYQLCATFNKDQLNYQPGYNYMPEPPSSWKHPAGHYCFNETIPVSQYKAVPTTVPAVLTQ